MSSTYPPQDYGGEVSTGHRDMDSYNKKLELPQITFRAIVAGIAIGSIVLISNFQFGLQTGWVSMMSLPSALLGFACFKILPIGRRFSDVENVFIQSVAVAVGTGPLAYGLVGIVPAIEKFLTADETGLETTFLFLLRDLLIWSFGLGLFGVFFAVPLRKQVIVKEKLPFPSGSATATLISVLHGSEIFDDSEKDTIPSTQESDDDYLLDNVDRYSRYNNTPKYKPPNKVPQSEVDDTYKSNVRSLTWTFVVSSIYTIIAYFIPILKNIPVFGSLLNEYSWNFQPSPAYIGQGIIMGLPTVLYMLLGAILGWGILAPLSKYKGWAPGEYNDYTDGAQGWILWISLSIMVSDSLVAFLVVAYKSIYDALNYWKKSNERNKYLQLTEQLECERTALLPSDDTISLISTYSINVDSKYLVSNRTVWFGVLLSSLICIISVKTVFGAIFPYYAIMIAVTLTFFFSVLGVRALGETDLNPVSGIGKLSQLIFALIIPRDHPSRVLINLVAGGIAEAGAQQAGDLMQDLKTGHLLGASPKAQFIAQIIGTLYSVFLSSIMYKVYNAVYEIPSPTFRIPTAIIWIDCSRLVTGEGLPPYAFEFSMIFGLLFAVLSLVKNSVPSTYKYHKYLIYIPNGVAVGIGIYNSPNFTIARFLGGLLSYWWMRYGNHNKVKMIIFSSGLILGEGLFSGFTLLLTSLGVRHL
jgi:OPT family oligopeptide transporter